MNPFPNLVRMTYGLLLTLEAPLPHDSPETVLKRFPVLLWRKVPGVPRSNEQPTWQDKRFYGHVVSYLDLADWCTMHGYQLFHSYPSIRRAKYGERTHLTSL